MRLVPAARLLHLARPGFRDGRRDAWPHPRPTPEGDVGPDQLLVAVVGYMSDQRPNWPPSYAEACTEPLEALGLIIKLTGIDEEGYDRLVALTEEILADPGFQRLQHAIARGVRLCRYLDGVGVLDLARAVGFPVTGSEATDATHETGREASVTPAANGDTPDR